MNNLIDFKMSNPVIIRTELISKIWLGNIRCALVRLLSVSVQQKQVMLNYYTWFYIGNAIQVLRIECQSLDTVNSVQIPLERLIINLLFIAIFTLRITIYLYKLIITLFQS